jgi:rRNA maturation protein Nop10
MSELLNRSIESSDIRDIYYEVKAYTLKEVIPSPCGNTTK